MVHIYIYVLVDISKIDKSKIDKSKIDKTNINKNLTLNIRYMGGCIVKKKIMDISVITSKKSHFFNEKCIICWENLPRYIYIPCGHFGVCTDCKIKMNESPHLNGCPYCNNESSKLYEIFFCGKKYERSDENILYLICKLNKKVQRLNKELENERTSNKKLVESIKEENDMNASIKEEN